MMCHSLWLPFPGLGYSINLCIVNVEKSCRVEHLNGKLILPYHHYVRWNLLWRNLTSPNRHDPLLLPITILCYFSCAQSQQVEITVLNDVSDASLKSPDRKKHEFKETESETIMYIVTGEKTLIVQNAWGSAHRFGHVVCYSWVPSLKCGGVVISTHSSLKVYMLA